MDDFCIGYRELAVVPRLFNKDYHISIPTRPNNSHQNIALNLGKNPSGSKYLKNFLIAHPDNKKWTKT